MLNQWQNQKNQRQKKLVNSQNQLLNQLLNQPEKLLLSLNPPLLNQLLHQQHNQLIGRRIGRSRRGLRFLVQGPDRGLD